MSGNTFGKLFTLTTAGESHGSGYVGIVDGCPPGLALSELDIQKDLDRRKPGQNKYTTPRKEEDIVKICSGVFEGFTTGTPISLEISNNDQKSKDYSDIKDKYRPGHADYTYLKKYGLRDHRGGGRSSARETCMRVAAGGIAKKYLFENFGTRIQGYLSQLGPIKLVMSNPDSIEKNPFFCADPEKLQELESFMDRLRKEGDSVGAKVSIYASNVPIGLGEPIFDRLDADLAKALMSINAVKGVEIGAGFEVVSKKGSEIRDEMASEGFISNNSGGILGGISNGQDILASLALKPTSSIRLEGNTIDRSGKETKISTLGRHDPCVGIRATPIAEAMVALVLMDHLLRDRGQIGRGIKE